MKTVVLLITIAVTLVHDTVGYSLAKSLLNKLDNQVESINDLLVEIQRTYRDDIYNHPMPRNHEDTLKRVAGNLYRATRIVERMYAKNCQNEDRVYEDGRVKLDSGESTRRSNTDLMWKMNFYKALSRALRGEYEDEPLVQENVYDGFEPPIFLKKRGEE